MPLRFYNTLNHAKEVFEPITKGEVRMYTCGPTVNNYAHIGNLRAYVFADILQKCLEYSGYNVKRVMNITDIGIMSSDADSGDDKMTLALIREGKELTLKNMRELAEFYTEKFKEDLNELGIKVPTNLYFASDYVKEDAELVEKLEEKGFAYKTQDGMYFDVSKMPDYGALWGGQRSTNEEYRRTNKDAEKRHPEDFALWKFNNSIGYESKWGQGFPGWHIECSVIGIKFLGEQFDIHTGGIDLIPTHHTNEIAQSESATGKKPFVKFWLHSEHVDTGNEKMSKSKGNFLRLSSVVEKGISPTTYRFWLLMASYHTKVNFSWEALEGADVALKRLHRLFLDLGAGVGQVNEEYKTKFKERIEDDLDTPKALSLLWDLVKDESVPNADKKATMLDFDRVLGLGFGNLKEEKLTDEVATLVKEREEARKQKDFKRSDELRLKINAMGYEVKDISDGQKVSKI